ncbi:hypothetical protein F2Q68_00026141 [Brassica cretica]|uniref:Uncharacterized protein n=1 Tax=Brassica cretica TaxID=69181 RepID=A0A8S9IFV3_BRACR|nr:hypothetical protein F2Q68_00026141 [Brassica cretica]
MSRWNWIWNLMNIDSNWWSLNKIVGSSHFRASRVICSLFCIWNSLNRQLLRFLSLRFLTSQLCCITVLNPMIHHILSRKGTLLTLDTLSCLSKLNINPLYVVAHSIILCIQFSEHVVHSSVDILQLIWLTVTGSWNNLSIALRLSLVLVMNLPDRSLLHVEDSAPVVHAAREQPVQQHPVELGWSAAFEASVVAYVATEHSWSLNVTLLVRLSEYV